LLWGDVYVESLLMAKKISKPGPKPDPQSPSRVRTAAVMLRGMPEWKTWLEELAEHDRAASIVELADRAFVAYAQAVIPT
jgi:hypothetical protein